eukprot:scaffold1501_cov352-Pavlova_lutheri.AAC.38
MEEGDPWNKRTHMHTKAQTTIIRPSNVPSSCPISCSMSGRTLEKFVVQGPNTDRSFGRNFAGPVHITNQADDTPVSVDVDPRDVAKFVDQSIQLERDQIATPQFCRIQRQAD